MNIKNTALGLAALLFLISCDEDTSSLGMNLIPEEDRVSVEKGTYQADSRSIYIGDSLLARSSTCYLGKYTDPVSGLTLSADYVTQLNCIEGFEFPDSVYGLEQFHFADSIKEAMEGVYNWKADLRLYFTSYFGDSTNTMTVEVYPLTKALDPETKYYSDFDPTEFYDAASEPLATVTVAPVDFNIKDSLREEDTYYPNMYIDLPDYIAEDMLRLYYSEGGKEKFADAQSFIDNVCKGYYIRCTQGDGTVMYIERTDLEINFKYLATSVSGEADSLASAVVDFTGGVESIQVNHFDTKGLDKLVNDESGTYMHTPFGVLTEVTLPIDEIAEGETTINSAEISFYRINTETSIYNFSTPGTILMLRKQNLASFFDEAATVDNVESFATTFTTSYNQYSFSNIARLVMTCRDDRAEWLEAKGMQADAAGKAAYEAANPDWNKVVLVPVTSQTDANSTVLRYDLDLSLNDVKLKGGKSAISIKTIRTSF